VINRLNCILHISGSLICSLTLLRGPGSDPSKGYCPKTGARLREIFEEPRITLISRVSGREAQLKTRNVGRRIQPRGGPVHGAAGERSGIGHRRHTTANASAYTAIVRGAGDTSGVGLVGDLRSRSDGRFAVGKHIDPRLCANRRRCHDRVADPSGIGRAGYSCGRSDLRLR